MHRIRHRARNLIIAVTVALVYVAVLVWFIRANSTDTSPTDPTLAGTAPLPTNSTAATPGAPSGSSTLGSSSATPDAPGASTGPRRTINPVVPGGYAFPRPPSHTIVLSATSAAAIGRVGYLVPTSLDNPIGDIRGIGRSWSVTTAVYGDPEYAELFVQAGKHGVPITCTITVDGKVTSRETTEGPYGRQVCIG